MTNNNMKDGEGMAGQRFFFNQIFNALFPWKRTTVAAGPPSPTEATTGGGDEPTEPTTEAP